MNQLPARLHERFRIVWRSGAEAVKQIAKRENSFDPQKNADRVNDAVIEYDRLEEPLLQCGSEQRLNNRRVVPDVESAPKDLRNHWRQRCHQQAVAFARSTPESHSANFHSCDWEVPNPNFQIPNKPQCPNAKSRRTTDYAENTDREELYSEYQCH